jgi:hypothetical protein
MNSRLLSPVDPPIVLGLVVVIVLDRWAGLETCRLAIEKRSKIDNEHDNETRLEGEE